jgi:hypothetical protein
VTFDMAECLALMQNADDNKLVVVLNPEQMPKNHKIMAVCIADLVAHCVRCYGSLTDGSPEQIRQEMIDALNQELARPTDEVKPVMVPGPVGEA